MRYEVMRLLQFVFSLSLIFAAFMGGMFVGWRRWGRPGPVDHSLTDDDGRIESQVPGSAPAAASGRRDLFAPELSGPWGHEVVDLRVEAGPTRLGLPTASGTPTTVGSGAAGGATPDALT